MLDSSSDPVQARAPKPLVSVVLPVYNGEQFLSEAIDSVLRQTLGDFELIVADNASADATRDIAMRYVQNDRRVRYLRHASNLGVSRNWTFGAQQARGKYLKWLSVGDYLAPELLATCAHCLDTDPTAVLCFPRTQQIDAQGHALGVFDHDFDVLSADPVERFLKVAARLCVNSPMSAGLIRCDAAHAVLPLGNYPGSDLVLMAKLALRGSFRLLPEVLYYRRTGDAYATEHRSPLQIERMYNPHATRPRRLSDTMRFLGYLGAAWTEPMSLPNRLRALLAAARPFYWGRRYVLQELVAPWR